MRIKPITLSLSPNTEADDVWLAMKLLANPTRWQVGEAAAKVEAWFENEYASIKALSYNSGRSALLEILKAFGIGSGDEVILQAFTCVAVGNSVLWAGAKPVYADIDDRLNIDAQDFEKKITAKTKAVIVQHTFGIPAKIDTIAAIAKRHGLVVIEDCAHALGATYRKRKLGSWGDAAFFSFGRDKIVSSVFGGLAIISRKHPQIIKKLEAAHNILPFPSHGWIFQQLFHPVAFAFILPFYRIGVGKLLLVIFQRLGWLSFPVFPAEKQGRRVALFPARYPAALAALLLNQLGKLNRYNERRRQSEAHYRNWFKEHQSVALFPSVEGSVWLRFPITVANPAAYVAAARVYGIFLGTWYSHVIDPVGVNYQAILYQPGSCPRAEAVSRTIVNLPTNIPQGWLYEITKKLNH
jgi:dTDP-4-amino-4,6-dideoxygalactose transaminase